MSLPSPLGALRTTRQQAEDAPGWFGSESPQFWDLIPGASVRDGGVYPAVLLGGYTYHLEYDGIGWQFTPEGDRPHAYLVVGTLGPVETLELAHKPVTLIRDRRYVISQDDLGAWWLYELGMPSGS